MQISASVLSKLVALLVLATQALSIELLKPIEDVYAFTDDRVALDIASYFKGVNRSLDFGSDHSAVTIQSAFTPREVNLQMSQSCRIMKKSNKGNLELVFGICNEGKSIVKITTDPVTWTIESGKEEYYSIPEGWTAKDYVVMNTSTKTESPPSTILIAAVKVAEGSSPAISIIEVDVNGLKFKKQTGTSQAAAGVVINDPSIAYDSTTENGLVILWDRKRSNENITMLAGRYKEDTGYTSIGWLSDVTDDISSMVKFANLKNLYIDGDKVYPFYFQTNVKMAFCSLVVTEQSKRIECTQSKEIFLNTDKDFRIALEILDNHELASINYYTDSSLKRVKVSTGMELNEVTEALYFEINLDLQKPIFIKSNGPEAVVAGDDLEGNPILLHWRTSRSYVSLNRDKSIRIGGFAVCGSYTDASKTDILYFNSDKKTFQVVTVSGAQLLINPSHDAFKSGSQVIVPYRVSDSSATRTYSIKVKVLARITDGMAINLPQKFTMYNGITAELPLFLTSFTGNSPSFEVTSNDTNLKLSMYMSKKMGLNLPEQEGQAKTLKNILNIGNDYFLFSYQGSFSIHKCIVAADNVDCWEIYQSQTNDKFIDGRSEQNVAYLLATREGDSQQQKAQIVLWSIELLVEEEKDRKVQTKVYSDLDAKGALGIIRISNFYVVIEIIGKAKEDDKAWRLFTTSFYQKTAFPEALNSSKPLPPHACPVSMVWAPRKQPILMINSLCEKGEREILEFHLEYLKPNAINLIKTWSFNTRSATDFCPTGSLLIIADLQDAVLYGIDSTAGDRNKVSFPLKAIGIEKLKGLYCSRHNDYFQVIGTKGDSDYLITYRTNTAYQPTKRIHSIEKIGSATSESLISQSHNYLGQEIFTMVLSPQGTSNQAFFFRLDTPKLDIDSSKIINSVTASLTVKAKSAIPGDPAGSQVEGSTLVSLIKQQVDLEVRSIVDKKVVIKENGEFLPVEQMYSWIGLQLGQEMVGDDKEKGKVEVKRPLNYKKGLYSIKSKLKGVRAAGNTIFAWSEGTIIVYENSVEKARFPEVVVASAEAITGEYSVAGTGKKERYTYLLGYSEATEKFSQRVFVIGSTGDDKWVYADHIIEDGTTYLEVHLIDPIKKRFVYGAANAKQESLKAAVFDMVYDEFKNSFLQIHKVNVVKSVHSKFAHVSMLMINKKIRLLYNLRSSNETYSVTVDPATLNTVSDVRMDFGLYTPMSFANAKFECTEHHSRFISNVDMHLSTDRKFYCASADPALTTVSFVMEYPADDMQPPKVLNMTSEPIIQGYRPKIIRTHEGYTILLLKKDEKFDNNLLPKNLQSESVLLQVWKNGENPMHTFVRLSDLGFPAYTPEVVRNWFYSIDMTVVNGEKIMIVGDNIEENELRGAALGSLGVKVNDRSVDFTKVKLRIQGLTNSVDIDLSENIAVRPHRSTLLIMLIISGVLIGMILLATCYYYSQKTDKQANLDEPELTEEVADTTITNETDYQRVI